MNISTVQLKSDIHTWIYPWIYPWISISTATLHIRVRDSVRTLRSATTTRLSEPFASTAIAKRAIRCSAPAPGTLYQQQLLTVTLYEYLSLG